MRRLRVRSPSAPLASSGSGCKTLGFHRFKSLQGKLLSRTSQLVSRLRPMQWVVLGLGSTGILVAFIFILTSKPDPPPAEIASDVLLVEGRAIYLERCLTCHGPLGRGDGPIAKNLAGPKPRDFVSEKWKYGDRPEDAFKIVANGAPNSSMPGWLGSLGAKKVRAVTAYVLYLAKKSVPDHWREAGSSPSEIKGSQ